MAHIRSLDANLIAPLQSLLELQHVSRAAERMHVSQSAMSATLARLRRHFDDELLVRAGSRYTLTPRGRQLLPLVNRAARAVEAALDVRTAFHPGSSDRRFTIIASDYAAGVLNPRLRALLTESAPEISVEFLSFPNFPIVERVILEFDLVIAPGDFGLPGKYLELFDDDFVCLLDARHPAVSAPEITVDMLCSISHAAAQFASNMATGADRILAQLGVRHRVAVVSNEWLSLPWLIRDTDLITLLPRRVATWWAERGGFVLREIPGGDSGRFTENMFWHPSRGGDEGLAWLRGQILAAVPQGLVRT